MTLLTLQPPRSRHLVVLRAGNDSLHPQWLAGPQRDFDLLVSYYGKEPGRHQDTADLYEHRPGPKWSCIADLLQAHPELVERYDVFWFPDDDLAADTDTLNRMFGLFRGLNLALAQPALTPNSYHSWKILLQHPGCVARYLSFVEVMAPIFTRAALQACLPTFSQSRSGWGLDWVWPGLVAQGRQDAIAVLDATPVHHTRPLGGNLYANNPELDPRRDVESLTARYGAERLRATAPYEIQGALMLGRLPWGERLGWALRRLNALRLLRRRNARR